MRWEGGISVSCSTSQYAQGRTDRGSGAPGSSAAGREHTAGMERVYAVGKRSPVGEEIQGRENVAMVKSDMMRGGDSERERAEEGSLQAR